MKTMSYRYDKKKQGRRRIRTFVITLLIALAMFTPVYSWLFDMLEKPFVRAWENKEVFFDGSENMIESFYGKTRLVEENTSLKEEIQRLKIDAIRTRFLSEELDKVYGIQTSDSSLQPARIVSFGSWIAADTFIVNQGRIHNIQVGDQVVAYDQIVLGTISEVYDETSRVELYSRVGQSIEGIIFPHDINIEIQGHGKGGFVTQIARDVNVVEGEYVYMLAEPRSLLGVVARIEYDARNPFKTVYLSYPVNVNDLNGVGIRKQTPNSLE